MGDGANPRDRRQEPDQTQHDQPYASSRLPGSGATEGAETTPGAKVIVGMIVLGQDGQTIGRVKEVRADDFLVDRMLARDVYVPFSAVTLVDGQVVAINVNAGDLDVTGWLNPPLSA